MKFNQMPGSQSEVFVNDMETEVKANPKREPLRSFVAPDQGRRPVVVETDADREAAVAAIRKTLDALPVKGIVETVVGQDQPRQITPDTQQLTLTPRPFEGETPRKGSWLGRQVNELLDSTILGTKFPDPVSQTIFGALVTGLGVTTVYTVSASIALGLTVVGLFPAIVVGTVIVGSLGMVAFGGGNLIQGIGRMVRSAYRTLRGSRRDKSQA